MISTKNLWLPILVATVFIFVTLFPVAAKRESEQKVLSLANPAAVRCIDDGYQLKPVVKNGIQVGNMCVDLITGKQCEVWDYYHELCRLSKEDPRGRVEAR